jgi:hypothetical protein
MGGGRMAEIGSAYALPFIFYFPRIILFKNIYLLSVKFYPKLNGVNFKQRLKQAPRFPLMQSLAKGRSCILVRTLKEGNYQAECTASSKPDFSPLSPPRFS